MSDPVTDGLTDWQNDADGADTNLPVGATPMGTGQSGELAGELRRVKSEMRGVSIMMSWERWLGLKNLVGTADIAFTFVNGTTFTVNDNFLATSRNVAVVGRRVKALMTGLTIYGTIATSAVASGTTTVTVNWDTSALNSSLREIQFGVEIRSLPPVSSITLGGDLSGTPAAATVVGIQGVPVNAAPPNLFDALLYNGTEYVPAPVIAPGAILVSVVVFTADDTYTKPANLINAEVEMVGGGGGSGAVNGAGSTMRCSAGGGGGGYVRKVFLAADLGATEAVVIGLGGGAGATPSGDGGDATDSTFVGLTAGGGKGGKGISAAGRVLGGDGGVPTGGDLNIPGQGGGDGVGRNLAEQGPGGGEGGDSQLGQGAARVTASNATAVDGRAGGLYGGGGGGGMSFNSGTDAAGAPGANGIVIIREYRQG